MKDASLWMHQRPRSCQTGGGPFLSEAVSSSMMEQGSHSCLEEEQSLGPALGCRAAGSGCPAGWECAARGTSCSTGSPYAGSWLQKHCPGARPSKAPLRTWQQLCSGSPLSLLHPVLILLPCTTTPHRHIPSGGTAVGLFPENSAQKPRGTWNPASVEVVGFGLFLQSKAQCTPSSFFWLAPSPEHSSSSHPASAAFRCTCLWHIHSK